jgi:hypothetical protein
MKGKPLYTWGAVLVAWISVRFASAIYYAPVQKLDIKNSPHPALVVHAKQAAINPAALLDKQGDEPVVLAQSTGLSSSSAWHVTPQLQGHKRYSLSANFAGISFSARTLPRAFPAQNFMQPSNAPSDIGAAHTSVGGHISGALTPPLLAPLLAPILLKPDPIVSGRLARWQVYAYAFVRGNSSNGDVLAPAGGSGAGQYGGSQFAVIARIQIGKQHSRTWLYTRITDAPSQGLQYNAQREFAGGITIAPFVKRPIFIAAERRIRRGKDATAVYLSAAIDPRPLLKTFTLSGYAQGGIVDSGQVAAFGDAALRLDKIITQKSNSKFSAGMGAWAGGQKGAQRLDIGPSIHGTAKLGKVNFSLSADWRFRVAGRASPGNGPALTLSAGL